MRHAISIVAALLLGGLSLLAPRVALKLVEPASETSRMTEPASPSRSTLNLR